MKQTTLDLNGPILSFITQPSSVSVCNAGIVTFVGIATASFPTQTPSNPALNTGSLSYRWYADGFGALSDGSFLGVTVAGSATTTLTLSGVTSPTLNGVKFYVAADYIPSAYSQPVGSAVTPGTQRTTGNAVNDVLNSNSATLTVFPSISITSQPTPQVVSQIRNATFSITATSTDTTQGSLSYQWSANGTNLSDGNNVVTGGIGNTASGTNTNLLTISSSTVGVQTVRCVVSHPVSCSSPIYSNVVTYEVVPARAILNYEQYNDGGTSILSSGSKNLFSEGSLSFTADPSNPGKNIIIYAPERAIRIKVTLAGAAGQSALGASGGQGGLSVFEYDILPNTEYNIKLGSTSLPSGGANGGGGAAFFYNRARIVALCAGGGAGGSTSRGGFGGGIGIAGEIGQGRFGGKGGDRAADGTLPTVGFFPGGATTGNPNTTAPTGGRVSACTIGNYWATQGYSPCQDIGAIKFYNGQGTIITTSATIQRGYKPGLAHRNTGGNGSGSEGGGGSGAYGGDAGGGNGSGGGGGSGYSNGELTLISTQLGGNTSTNSYAIIELVS